MTVIFFLVSGTDRKPVPLIENNVSFECNDLIYSLNVNQTFCNESDETISATYRFPLENNLAVSDFEFTMNGKTFVGTVMEKEKAREEFKNAVQRGQTASKMESESSEIFETQIGNIPPNTSISVKIRCIGQVKVENGDVRLMFPTAIAPRYGESVNQNKSRMCKFSFKGLIIQPSGVGSATCASHGGARFTFTSDSSISQATNNRIEFDLNSSEPLNKDVVVLLSLIQSMKSEPRVYVHRFDEQTAVALINFIPHLSDSNGSDCKDVIIFLIDRSGSMNTGKKLESLKKSLDLAIRSMPSNQIKFNLIGFGSTFSSLFNEPVPFTESNVKLALDYISKISADMGGTELLNPIQYIIDSTSKLDALVHVVVLTDGEIDSSHMTQIFTKVC